jgi:hypothetical protein
MIEEKPSLKRRYTDLFFLSSFAPLSLRFLIPVICPSNQASLFSWLRSTSILLLVRSGPWFQTSSLYSYQYFPCPRSSTLNTMTAGSFETIVAFYQITRRHIPEHNNLHIRNYITHFGRESSKETPLIFLIYFLDPSSDSNMKCTRYMLRDKNTGFSIYMPRG